MTTQFIEGNFDAKGYKFGIVLSRFNDFIGNRLLDGALDALKRHGAEETNISVVKVPGAFEIPSVLNKVVAQNRFDAVICLGAVIKGDTPHFDYITAEVMKGIAQVSMNSKVPIATGILTTDNLEQAIERAGTKSGNKGFEAAKSAVEMVNLYKRIEG